MTFRSIGLTTALILLLQTPLLAFAGTTEQMDKLADFIAIVVILVVPIAGIVIFWKLHILPEKIAEKRHHPNAEAIKVLCLLSLFIGGLLWPIAWLWAYTKPIGYKMAYGTEKADSFFIEALEKLEKNELSPQEIQEVHAELDTLSQKKLLNPKLISIFDAFAKHINTKES
jgi:hypothetical protein